MPINVVLNVYDLIEQTPICCGFFHTGVEVNGVEFSFAGGAGVYDCTPRSAPDGRFRESIVLGTIASSAVAVAALDRVRPEFHGDAYSLIFRNCNDFSSAFAKAMLGHDIPGWVNRLARLGRMWPIHCFLPAHMKAGASGAPGDAPLLSRRQQRSEPVIFQGSGNTLSGASTGGGCRGPGGLLSRLRGAFSRGPAVEGGAEALVAGGGDARELRAAAAARRLSSEGGDLEAGSGGRAGAPMPNPWS